MWSMINNLFAGGLYILSSPTLHQFCNVHSESMRAKICQVFMFGTKDTCAYARLSAFTSSLHRDPQNCYAVHNRRVIIETGLFEKELNLYDP